MTTQRFANRASALTTATVLSSDTIITVQAGGGGLFPGLAVGQVFQAALIAATGDVEYITITAIAGDSFTVMRAQEGTAALTFPTGSRLEQRLTAMVMEGFLQKSGGVMAGPLNMNGQQLLNVDFDDNIGTPNIHCNLLRSLTVPLGTPYNSGAEGAIYFPSATAFPRVFNSILLTAALLSPIIFDAYLDLNNIPSYLRLCDGTNGTPDLRGRFIIGARPDLPVGSLGGAFTYTTSKNGGIPDRNANDAVLTSAMLPDLGFTTINTVPVNPEPSSATRVLRDDTRMGYNNATARAHTHLVFGQDGHQHTVDVVPPYMALAKVMFIVGL